MPNWIYLSTMSRQFEMEVLSMHTTQVSSDVLLLAYLLGANDTGIDVNGAIKPVFPGGRKFGVLANCYDRPSTGWIGALTYVNG
jgi:hypothetical protein